MTITEIKDILSEEGFRPTISDTSEITIKIGEKLYYVAMMANRSDYLTVYTYQSFGGTALLPDFWAIQEGIKLMERIVVGKCLPVGRDKDKDLLFRLSVETFATPESLKRYFNEYIHIVQTLLEALSIDLLEEKAKTKNIKSDGPVQ